MKANFIQSGICCQLRWALLGEITFNHFLEKYWCHLERAYSFHLAHQENRFAVNTAGKVPFLSKDVKGNTTYIHADLNIEYAGQLAKSGALGVHYYPGKRMISPLLPFHGVDIPLLCARGKEEFLLLPPVWRFMNQVSYDLLIIARPHMQLLMIWPDSCSGSRIAFSVLNPTFGSRVSQPSY